MKVGMMAPVYVNTMPIRMDEGKLYISLIYGTAQHLCPCGCGQRVVTPLNKNGWTLTFNGKVSLTPSIGNYEIECKSHYFITDNGVHWIQDFQDAEPKIYKSQGKEKKKKRKKKWKFKKQFPFLEYS